MKKLIFLFSIIFFHFEAVVAETKIKSLYEGSVDAKVSIIVYESLTCGHCAEFHKNVYPKLKEKYIDTGLASIEFKSFPLDIAALNASKVAHCRNDGKSEILHFLFDNQSKWAKGNSIEEFNENLKKVLDGQKFGIDFEKCIGNKKIEDYVLENRIEGVKKFKVNATPTIIINGEKFNKPLTFKNLKKFLEKLI